MGSQTGFLRDREICRCITNELCWAAIEMYKTETYRQMFRCKHGTGLVTTQFETKMLGSQRGIYFESVIQKCTGHIIIQQFVFPTDQLYIASGETERDTWYLETTHEPCSDLPQEAIS